MKELSIEDMKGQGLNIYLTKVINAIFELSNMEELEEITSLNYDIVSNKLLIGVSTGIWVLSEDSKGLKGVFYGDC